jgi:hypothetical protein
VEQRVNSAGSHSVLSRWAARQRGRHGRGLDSSSKVQLGVESNLVLCNGGPVVKNRPV